MLYVAIIDMAIPGEYFWECPANVKVIGMIDAVPKPTRLKPSIDGQKVGRVTASPMPTKIKDALMI
jgi:hypothetical protein